MTSPTGTQPQTFLGGTAEAVPGSGGQRTVESFYQWEARRLLFEAKWQLAKASGFVGMLRAGAPLERELWALAEEIGGYLLLDPPDTATDGAAPAATPSKDSEASR